jgi:lipid II:glycine glycyltransferase (peptidoglycan interpeptide bridge formation enzyme)
MARSPRRSDLVPVHRTGGYSVRVSEEPDDPAWDDFLEKAPGSAYTQTSCWGRARESIGWRPIRIVISEGDRVVAGVQMERRSLPVGGVVGFVFGGPVVGDDRPDLAGLVLDEMMAMDRAANVRYLAVQPSPGCERMSAELARRGFRPGILDFLYIYFAASLSLDLRPSPEELLAKMSKKRRQNIRAAAGRGVTVRRGSGADLAIFSHLKDAHAARLGYARRDEGYYEELWRVLAPRGHIVLFIAEYQGEPIAAQLAIPFGDTSHHIERPWSGAHGELRASELVEWETMKWAKAEGYRFADLGGIETPVAEAILSGGEEPRDSRFGASLFKLRWGGRIVVDPPFLDYVYDPVLRFGYRCIPRSVMGSRWMERLVKRLRGA